MNKLTIFGKQKKLFPEPIPIAMKGFRLLLLTLSGICSCLDLSAQFQPVDLTPRMRSNAEKAIRLDELSVNIEILGGVALTKYEMLFYNPNSRVLEGELILPMAEHEMVVGYALEVNGKMRDGVVVDKAKGRQVFEEIVNRNVDPGLLEKTDGNSYRTRIYPVPARGFKRVTVTTQQVLRKDEYGSLYILPMTTPNPLAKFELRARVIQSSGVPQVTQSPLSGLRFDRQQHFYEASYSQQNQTLSQPLIFSVPDKEAVVTIERDTSLQWFYASVPTVRSQILTTGKQASNEKIALWWDVSLSGLHRDIEKEIGIVEMYLAGKENYRVEVVCFSDEIRERKSFTDSHGLTQYLRELTYDGATDLTVLDCIDPGKADKILLFSDGKSSLGQRVKPVEISGEVYALTSAPDNDYPALNALSRGQLINLSSVKTEEAVARLEQNALRLLSVKTIEGEVADVYPKPGVTIAGDLSLTGKLHSDRATLEVSWGVGNTIVKTERVVLDASRNELSWAQGKGVVPRLWAQAKIAQLSADGGNSKQEITDLGVRYGVVTDYTSLIVLETLSDYITYDIIPPREMLTDEYERLLSYRNERKTREEKKANERAENTIDRDYNHYYKPLIEWWKRDYEPFDPKKKPEKQTDPTAPERRGMAALRAASPDALSEIATIAAHDESAMRVSEDIAVEVTRFGGSYTGDATEIRLGGRVPEGRLARNTIALEGWKPDAPYMEKLLAAPDDGIYEVYLALRPENLATPAFFVDVADELARRGDKQTARRVLSNIIEISQQQIEMVKTYGQKLIEYELYASAVPVFAYGAEIREEHPQSHRDLALAYEFAGQYQLALEEFLVVLTRQWSRFDNIKPIVFSEMNSLIDRFGKELDLSKVPEKLRFSMPVNTRVTISWGTDNCDIDLHVTDPSGEDCYYRNQLTRHGGKMSDDFTDGFGPEAYMIRRKNPGMFEIYVNYYGTRSQRQLMPVTVYTDVFTDYGLTGQKRERLTIRLREAKERFRIGQIKVE